MRKFFVFMREDDYWMIRGQPSGYSSLEEAKREAKKFVDDALPQNYIYVMEAKARAYLAGDGGEEVEDIQ